MGSSVYLDYQGDRVEPMKMAGAGVEYKADWVGKATECSEG